MLNNEKLIFRYSQFKAKQKQETTSLLKAVILIPNPNEKRRKIKQKLPIWSISLQSHIPDSSAKESNPISLRGFLVFSHVLMQ